MLHETDWGGYDIEHDEPPDEWLDEHEGLWEELPDLLNRVPSDFTSDVHIEGIESTDVFGLNEVLASSVETQVVESLNTLKPDVDLGREYGDYEFRRQSQTYPDAILTDPTNTDEDPVIGIELKCWYLLSKEAEPSFRFKTTPEVCAPWDVLVIYPWSLSNVVTGEPEIYRPFIMPARFASRLVDYYWQELKDWDADDPDKRVQHPEGDLSHYPDKKVAIQDKPVQDGGGNYGRVRGKAISYLNPLEEYKQQMMSRELLGVPVGEWVNFFEEYADESDGLEDLDGIGETYAERLREEEIETPEELREADLREVLAYDDGWRWERAIKQAFLDMDSE